MGEYSMVQECTDSYAVSTQEDGRTKIVMIIPERFKWLWMTKLSDLRTNDEEIDYWDSDDEEPAS